MQYAAVTAISNTISEFYPFLCRHDIVGDEGRRRGGPRGAARQQQHICICICSERRTIVQEEAAAGSGELELSRRQVRYAQLGPEDGVQGVRHGQARDRARSGLWRTEIVEGTFQCYHRTKVDDERWHEYWCQQRSEKQQWDAIVRREANSRQE